jgi:hypothetical protein
MNIPVYFPSLPHDNSYPGASSSPCSQKLLAAPLLWLAHCVQDAVQLPERTFSAKDNKPTNHLIEGATPFFGRFSGNKYVKEPLTTCSSFQQQKHRVKSKLRKRLVR